MSRQLVLTAAGARRIEEELRQLQTVRRQEVADHIREAKALGDVSENSEYEEAKNEQAFLESRIAELKTVLGTAQVIDTSEVSTEEVSVGSVVTVRDLEADEEWEFTMVGSWEADPMSDQISNESPIGEALCGRRVGDVVEVAVPAGTARYQVLAIRRPGE